jgi:hypothetical protein
MAVKVVEDFRIDDESVCEIEQLSLYTSKLGFLYEKPVRESALGR